MRAAASTPLIAPVPCGDGALDAILARALSLAQAGRAPAASDLLRRAGATLRRSDPRVAAGLSHLADLIDAPDSRDAAGRLLGFGQWRGGATRRPA